MNRPITLFTLISILLTATVIGPAFGQMTSTGSFINAFINPSQAVTTTDQSSPSTELNISGTWFGTARFATLDPNVAVNTFMDPTEIQMQITAQEGRLFFGTLVIASLIPSGVPFVGVIQTLPQTAAAGTGETTAGEEQITINTSMGLQFFGSLVHDANDPTSVPRLVFNAITSSNVDSLGAATGWAVLTQNELLVEEEAVLRELPSPRGVNTFLLR